MTFATSKRFSPLVLVSSCRPATTSYDLRKHKICVRIFGWFLADETYCIAGFDKNQADFLIKNASNIKAAAEKIKVVNFSFKNRES